MQEALAKLESLTGGHAAYAAFSAADFQAPHVRQPKTWLYVASDWEDKFREVAEAKLVDSGENLVVLIPEDDGVFYLRDGAWADAVVLHQPGADLRGLVSLRRAGRRSRRSVAGTNLKRAWKQRGLL